MIDAVIYDKLLGSIITQLQELYLQLLERVFELSALLVMSAKMDHTSTSMANISRQIVI